MSNIREEIQEAQRLFSHGKGKRGGHDQNPLPVGNGMKGIRVAIVHNQESKSVEVTKRLTTLLEQSENMIDQDNPELVISVGRWHAPFCFSLVQS